MSLPKRRSSKVANAAYGNNNNQQCKASFHQLHQVLKTLVFFCDGMSWSYILPSGPTALFRCFQPEATSSLWSLLAVTSLSFPLSSPSYTDLYAIYHYLESVIAVYVLGRCLGKIMSKQLQLSSHKESSSSSSSSPNRAMYSIRVTRVVTASLFVHIFAAGIVPEAWTVVLRLVTAILAGMLCDMTSIASLGEVIVHAVWNVSTATKVHWIGFVTCVLLTSFIRAHQAIFMTPLAVVGFAVAAKLVFSPFFLTGIAVGAEIILRFLFAFTPDHQTTIPRQISTTRTSPRTSRNSSNSRRSSFKTSSSSVEVQDATRRPSRGSITRQSSSISSSRRPSLRQSSSVVVEPKPDSNSTNSSFSSLEESERAANPTTSSHNSEICIYRDGQCVYPDGTPAVSLLRACLDFLSSLFVPTISTTTVIQTRSMFPMVIV